MELPVHRENLLIRLATRDDLPALCSLPWAPHAPGTFADRLTFQDAGAMEFLLAVLPTGIAGSLLLKWQGPEDPELRTLLPACAEIEDLVVDPGHRRHGIGRLLLDVATGRTVRHGMSRLGLAVTVDNTAARELYDQQGFSVMEHSAHDATWLTLNDDGSSQLERTTCLYMMKDVS